MPIYSAKNLYPGVNPHLNSALQAGNIWGSFYLEHLHDLTTAMDTLLAEGFYIAPVWSLIGSEDFYLMAAVIFTPLPEQVIGNHCTRIEILTPAHKSPSPLHKEYLEKRAEIIKSGINLVEIDYLHTQPPLLRILPSYASGDNHSSPYQIAVTASPNLISEGVVDVYQFGVDDTLPTIQVPIAEGYDIIINFTEIYDKTYSGSRLFKLLTDYAAEPAQFDRYQPQDRQRIRARMAAIAAEHGTQEGT